MKIIYSLLVLLAFNLNAQTQNTSSYDYYYDISGSFGFDLSSYNSIQVYGGNLELDSSYGLRNSSGSGGLDINDMGNVEINDSNLLLADDSSSYGLRNSSGYGGLNIDSSGNVKINGNDLFLADGSSSYGLRNSSGYGGLNIDGTGNVKINGYDLHLASSSYGLRNSSGYGGLNIDGSGNVKINGYDLHLADGSSYGLRNSSGSGGLKIDSSGDVLIVSDLSVVGNTIKSSSDTVMELSSDDVTFSDNVTVTGDVVISSDARLKSNIISLGSTISKLLLLDGKSYKMNLDGDQKIGVLAQDVQKVFPELVTKGDNEMLAVNYLGLVPVLINALKEQQKEIETYRNEVSDLKKQFAEILSSN